MNNLTDINSKIPESDNIKNIFVNPSNQEVIPVERNLSYEKFFQCYLVKNVPCLIQDVGKDWESSKSWCTNGKPCFDHLKNKYGESSITAYHCNDKYFDSHKTSTMSFKEYVCYWEKYGDAKDKTGMELLYLKDWHLKNECKDDNFYEVPVYFSSDWLNEYLIATDKDDYRFVYMGPAGSWTPLHKDVMDSFSWSVNICGLKKWILFPPGQETYLMDELGQLPHNIENLPENIKYSIVIQHPGDALFVPSQWYHQVWNLKDTISINHNWVNAANVKSMKSLIISGLNEIKKELEHLSSDESFEEECQKVLKCHVGMNFQDFLEFIHFIALRKMQDFVNLKGESESLLDKDMVEFELKQIKKVLFDFDGDEVENLRKEIESLLN